MNKLKTQNYLDISSRMFGYFNMGDNFPNEFWECIDKDIKPLVKLFQDYGFETLSSCEGHKKDNISYYANVKFFTDKGNFKLLRALEEYESNQDYILSISKDVLHRPTAVLTITVDPDLREDVNKTISYICNILKR